MDAANPAPAVELDSRDLTLLSEINALLARSEGLADFLHGAIQKIAEHFGASIGSVYLFEGAGPGNDLVMRAGFGADSSLVGLARYAIGEGLTGKIAVLGKLINLKTQEDRHTNSAWLGKYQTERGHVGLEDTSPAYLGVPIYIGDVIVGVWKLEHLSASPSHPDSFFTRHDEILASMLSIVLAAAIAATLGRPSALSRDFVQLAISSLTMERVRTEQEAILTLMEALDHSRFGSALLSFVDHETGTIQPIISTGTAWNRLQNKIPTRPDSNDILAIVLKSGAPELVEDARTDPRCNNDTASNSEIVSQYVLPLVAGDERLGVLQVALPGGQLLQPDETVVLQSFVGHFAVALSRIRQQVKLNEITETVVSNSRFIVAEELAGWAVHSLSRRLHELGSEIRHELGSREVRENRFLSESFTRWKRIIDEASAGLDAVLGAVRGGPEFQSVEIVDVHAEIQRTLDLWFSYLRSHACHVECRLEAKAASCALSRYAVRELFSVMLVNSVQAFAKRVIVKSTNASTIFEPKGNYIEHALIVDVSDDGVGLVTADTEEVFSSRYSTKAHAGTGLGLFVARRLARRGGGNLIVAADHPFPKGVTFRTILPTPGASHKQ